jgi:GNAT superfamily N-acetyltransferase
VEGNVKPRYRIRAVDADDPVIADVLEDLHRLTFGRDASLPVENGDWPGHWWVAYSGEKPVAFAGLVQSPHEKTSGYLSRVGVIAAHRGNGLQKRLVRALDRSARESGFEAVVTDTTHNPPSANSLIACGYKTYRPRHPWSFEAAVYWRKEL